jgi:glutamate mutase epsilon subunit
MGFIFCHPPVCCMKNLFTKIDQIKLNLHACYEGSAICDRYEPKLNSPKNFRCGSPDAKLNLMPLSNLGFEAFGGDRHIFPYCCVRPLHVM